MDVSPDGARIATGTENLSACVWSLETGERVFDPLKHQFGAYRIGMHDQYVIESCDSVVGTQCAYN